MTSRDAESAAFQSAILRLEDVGKHYGHVKALESVSFEIYPDELVGLVGDNGAGKSTLIKIISGNFPPDEGRMLLAGKPADFRSPADAKDAGIETVYQGLSLCENLDSVANLFIGREMYKSRFGLRILQKNAMEARAEDIVKTIGVNIPSIHDRVEYLSGGERQSIAFARAILWGVNLVLLDEPTAALGVRETANALRLISTMRKEKKLSVILISHNLEHVFSIADRIIVLRHGRVVGVRRRNETTVDEIVSMITGAVVVNATA